MEEAANPLERRPATDHKRALQAERRSQVRALLVLAVTLLLFLLLRARALHLFHPGWWRL